MLNLKLVFLGWLQQIVAKAFFLKGSDYKINY